MNSYREFRDDLAKQMREKIDARNQKLEKIDRSVYSEWQKENMRKKIMENFYNEYGEMKKTPWFEEAKALHVAERKAKFDLEKTENTKEDPRAEYEGN